MIVATAGHIDHGKTTLVKALTGVDTDRLPEEKARGISIDLGFAYWQIPDVGTIGFVDVPGHERFVRNMLAGVCGIDYVMLVIAADDGIMPQTVEHLHIVDLLRVMRGAAVLTKIDRVSPERAAEVTETVRGLLETTSLAGSAVIPVSAVTGDGVARLRSHLREATARQSEREQHGRHFRYAIDRAFTVAGSGTVVTGTVFNGKVAVDDHLIIAPAGRPVRVRAIQQQGESAAHASAGERCALNLAGLELGEIARGDWAVAPALAFPTQQIDALVRVLASEEQPIRHWTPVHVHLGTADVTARLAIRRGASIAPGASARARLVLDRPICALHGDRFVLRDQSAWRTVGGGSVIDAFPPVARRRTPVREAQLSALEQPDAVTAFAALLACTPEGVDVKSFARLFNLLDDRVDVIAESSGAAILGKETRVALARTRVAQVKQAVQQAVARFHRDSPQASGAAVEDLRGSIASDLPHATFVAILRELASSHAIQLGGSTVRMPTHVATANAADEKMWRSVRPELERAGFGLLVVHDLAVTVRVDESKVRDFLHRKSRTGDIVRVTPERFALRGTMAQLAAIAQGVARASTEGRFAAAQFRDAIGTGRTLAIEILECMDRLGITLRVGDSRRIGVDYVPIVGEARTPFPVEKPAASASAVRRSPSSAPPARPGIFVRRKQ